MHAATPPKRTPRAPHQLLPRQKREVRGLARHSTQQLQAAGVLHSGPLFSVLQVQIIGNLDLNQMHRPADIARGLRHGTGLRALRHH